jgi:hypothetical protein
MVRVAGISVTSILGSCQYENGHDDLTFGRCRRVGEDFFDLPGGVFVVELFPAPFTNSGGDALDYDPSALAPEGGLQDFLSGPGTAIGTFERILSERIGAVRRLGRGILVRGDFRVTLWKTVSGHRAIIL